jgi:hypothetical protein
MTTTTTTTVIKYGELVRKNQRRVSVLQNKSQQMRTRVVLLLKIHYLLTYSMEQSPS